MKKIINRITIVLLMAFAAACVDESLDPVKFNEVKKATMLALRGSGANNTACPDTFLKNSATLDPATEAFSYEADFLAEDQETLQEVQVFAQVLVTSSGGLTARARAQVGTIPGSAFTFPTDSKTKRGIVSVKLQAVMTALNIVKDSLVKLGGYKDADGETVITSDITMTADLLLTDGSKVLASSLANVNLFQSVVFYPAQVLTYCANDQDDLRPVATTSLLGTWGLSTDGKKVERTKIPALKSGAKDTLYFTYDYDIIDPPTVTVSPASGGTVSAVVKSKKVDSNGFYTKDDSKNGFYVIYTAGSTYTGAVTATITGATAEIADGVVLAQNTKKQTITVDNTAAIIVSTSTGTRIGKDQFVTITVTFNEKLDPASSKAIKLTVDGTPRGLADVTDAKMTVASNGLSASYNYIFKLEDPITPVNANHGNLTVVFTDASDLAGNTTAIPSANLIVDVGIPPAPTLTLSGTWDLGTQISWSAAQTTGGTNSGGSTTGKVYFIALTAGDPAPTKFSVDLDGIATWLGTEDDPDSQTTPKAKLPIDGKQQGIVTVAGGASANPTFTPFTANNSTVGLDIYAVFVSSSGTISAISAPQLTGVVMQ